MPVEVVTVPITKTPVSELQEYCQKCKKTPEYKLQSTDGKPHSPSFKFICKVLQTLILFNYILKGLY